jgi:hypothetical protein
MDKFNDLVKGLSERYIKPENIFSIDSSTLAYACLNTFEKEYIMAIFAFLMQFDILNEKMAKIRLLCNPASDIQDMFGEYFVLQGYEATSDDETDVFVHENILNPVKNIITSRFCNWSRIRFQSHEKIQAFIKIKIGEEQRQSFTMNYLATEIKTPTPSDLPSNPKLPSYQVDICEATFLNSIS